MAAQRRMLGAQVGKFAVVGVASTVLNLALFAAFTHLVSHQWANGSALVISTVFNTAINRRYTFNASGAGGALKVPLQSLLLLAITWALTAGALAILGRLDPDAGSFAATATVAAGNVVATIVRFVLLRRWFAPDEDTELVAAESAPTTL